MEITKALRMLIELAQQNVIEDDDLEGEAKRQQDAIESAELFLQELENPSPIKVKVVMASNNVPFAVYANVPVCIGFQYTSGRFNNMQVIVDPATDI